MAEFLIGFAALVMIGFMLLAFFMGTIIGVAWAIGYCERKGWI